MLTLDRTVLALERISAVSINILEAAKYKVFEFFLVYCYSSLFVYFLVLVCYFLSVVFNCCCFSLFYFLIKKNGYCFMWGMLNSEGEA
jgi:hypothetical protein